MKTLDQLRQTMRRDQVWEFLLPPVNLQLDVTHGEILYLEDVSVSFDGFKAINNLNLYIEAGELRCIIGPNGAGKTTMMDIITGKTRPDTGSVWFGQRIDLLQAVRTGNRPGRHRSQVPEADRIRTSERIRKPGAGHGR